MANASKGASVGLIALGGTLIWSGLKGKKVTAVLRDIISGKSPANAPGTPIEGISSANTAGDIAGDSTGLGGGDTGAGTAEAAKNQAIAAPLASLYGWPPGSSNWNSLVELWNRESGWSNTAENPSSGAYGIAQALGHGPTNQYPAGPANPPISSAAAQIAWGLNYIKSTYGNPNAAWAHEVSAGWY